MKKLVFLLVLLVLPLTAGGEVTHIKLRSNHHAGFLRIVLEGPESVISRAIVNQRMLSVLVTFPETIITVLPEKVVVGYKKQDQGAIAFYPGEFRGLKVITLKHPSRLVVDIYQDDKEGMFEPLITKRKEREEIDQLKSRVIVIDPGHGGYEHGIVKNGYQEKNIALDIARKLRSLVGQVSSEVYLTRKIDLFMSQRERVKSANSREPDIFISLHVGKHRNIVVYAPVITDRTPDIIKPYLENKGQEDYLRDTALLLNAMKEALSTEFGADMVAIKPLPYSILSKIQAASVLVELPSFDDAAYIEEFRADLAATLYKGLYIFEESDAR